MNNEHHFYHSGGKSGRARFRREIERQQQAAEAGAYADQPMSWEKEFNLACARLEQLLPRDKYLKFMHEEVWGTGNEMMQAVEDEIVRLEADPMREFYASDQNDEPADFDPAMDTDLYSL